MTTGHGNDRVPSATTFLFLPATRTDRLARALDSGADVVVLDLEDAVPVADKDPSRSTAYAAVSALAVAERERVLLRVNATGTPWHADDVEAATRLGVGVMLPKCESAGETAELVRLLAPAPVVALVETATGVLAAAGIAATGVARLALGTFDLAAELAVHPDDRDAMRAARGHLVLASAAAGLPGPVDGVTAAVADEEAVRDDAGHARRLGLTAKLCIHPKQVATAAAALRPSQDEITWATTVLAAVREASDLVVIDGSMVDKPVIERAQRVLRAARTEGEA